jgi:hypothetical protein
MGGNKQSSIVALPMPIVLKKMSECLIPDDREQLLDLVEMVDINLSLVSKTRAISLKQFKDADGMLMLVKLMKRMIEDPTLIAVSVQTLEQIKTDIPSVMDFIQFGGMDIFDKAMKIHAADNFLSITVPKFLAYVSDIGATASIKDIEEEALNLCLCKTCQETIERAKREKNKFNFDISVKLKIPKSSERVNRVLKFMDSYISRVDVQVAGLTALMNFARNADAVGSVKDTNMITLISICIKAHPLVPEIIWRAALCLSVIAQFTSDIAYEISLLEVHELLVTNFASFKDNLTVQQQILAALASCLKWPRSKAKLHTSGKLILFFKELIEKMDELKVAPEKIKKGSKASENMLARYELVVPLLVRTFMRETGGRAVEAAPASKRKIGKFKQRRNFDERPKFGTVDTAVFVSGEGGLISTQQELDEDAGIEKKPDWDDRLNYVEKGKANVIAEMRKKTDKLMTEKLGRKKKKVGPSG